MPTCPTCGVPATPTATLDASGIACRAAGDWVPDRVGKALLLWLRFHFGAAGRATRPALKPYVWTDSPASPLHIGTLAEYQPAVDGVRPCLLVERGDQREDPAARGIGWNRLGGQAAGPRYVVVPKTGTHVVFCVGGREGEVDEFAREVENEADAFCRAVAERLGLRRFYCTSVGRRQKLSEHKDTWTSPVFFGYDYDVSQTVQPAGSPTLRDTFLALADLAVS